MLEHLSRGLGIPDTALTYAWRIGNEQVVEILSGRKLEAPGDRYFPLRNDKKEIRLLRILSRARCKGLPDDSLHCTLEHVSRDSEVPYTALSYAWGNEDERCLIRVGGMLHYIGANLNAALRELQGEADDVILWIDQICINQSDDDEKNHQVSQMKDIYSKAERVVAWLGPAADDSDLLMFWLKQMSAVDTSAKALRDFVAYHNTPECMETIPIAFDKFCRRKYWTRLWIIQELGVARSLTLNCGSASLTCEEWYDSWLQIESSRETLKSNTEFLCCIAKSYTSSAFSFSQGIMGHRIRYQLGVDQPTNFLFRVVVTVLVLELDYNHPETSFPRDRIFSLLGLACDAAAFPSFPDYANSTTCEDVYEEAARCFLRQGHVDVLSYCQFPRSERNRRLATWAPDWYMPTRKPCGKDPWPQCSNFSAGFSESITQFPLFSGPNLETLSLLGIAVDKVERVGSLWNPDWLGPIDTQAAFEYLADIKAFCQESPRFEGGELDVDVARIAINDCFPFPSDDPAYTALYKQFYRSAVDSFKKGRQGDDPWLTNMKLLHSRRSFISQSGYVGLAPDHVSEGDLICIFLGGKAAYTLRLESEDVYSLVGETYVYGIMHGEIFASDPSIGRFSIR